MSSRKRERGHEENDATSASASPVQKKSKSKHIHAVQADAILSRSNDADPESDNQALYTRSVPFQTEDCAKWATNDRNHAVDAAERRKQICKQVRLMARGKTLIWTDVVKRLFLLYDRVFLDGKLGRMLDGARVSIQIMLMPNSSRFAQTPLENHLQLHLHRAALKSLEFPALICGIVCEDQLAALQVGLEHQIARLVAQTGCNTRVAMPASTLSRTDALAQGLFGHVPPPRQRTDLDQLPDALVDLIGRLLPSQSFVQLARASRSVSQDVKNVPIENEWVPMSTIGPKSVGRFRSVQISSRRELQKLPQSITHLQLHFTEEEEQSREPINIPDHIRELYINCNPMLVSDSLQLPASLIDLTFGECFNQPVEKLQLPASLTHLTFGCDFNQPVEELQLPASLTHLTFGQRFNHSINQLRRPASLTSIIRLNGDNTMTEIA
jgi:hypothetical protein